MSYNEALVKFNKMAKFLSEKYNIKIEIFENLKYNIDFLCESEVTYNDLLNFIMIYNVVLSKSDCDFDDFRRKRIDYQWFEYKCYFKSRIN